MCSWSACVVCLPGCMRLYGIISYAIRQAEEGVGGASAQSSGWCSRSSAKNTCCSSESPGDVSLASEMSSGLSRCNSSLTCSSSCSSAR